MDPRMHWIPIISSVSKLTFLVFLLGVIPTYLILMERCISEHFTEGSALSKMNSHSPIVDSFPLKETGGMSEKFFWIKVSCEWHQLPSRGDILLTQKWILNPGLPLAHRCASLMRYSPEWHTITTFNTLPWRRIQVVFKNTFFWRLHIESFTNSHQLAPETVAKTLLAVVICNQLCNIAYIFRHCDLLDLNRIFEKKHTSYE